MTETVVIQFFVMFGGIVTAIIVTVRLMIKSNETIVREFAREQIEALRDSIKEIVIEQRNGHQSILEEIRRGNREVVHEIQSLVSLVMRSDPHRDCGGDRRRDDSGAGARAD